MGTIFLTGDFSDGYEARIRRSTGKNNKRKGMKIITFEELKTQYAVLNGLILRHHRISDYAVDQLTLHADENAHVFGEQHFLLDNTTLYQALSYKVTYMVIVNCSLSMRIDSVTIYDSMEEFERERKKKPVNADKSNDE